MSLNRCGIRCVRYHSDTLDSTCSEQKTRDSYELVQMSTAAGRVLHPLEQMAELNDSDDDEPLLSGSGPVNRESGQEKLDEWGEIIKNWEGNPKPKEVDPLIQNFGIPQVRDWASFTRNNE